MSYSRWSDSRWYTYWCVSDSDKRSGQVFDVCTDGAFTYAELASDIEHCLSECGAEGDERNELREYMRAFMRDVERAPELRGETLWARLLCSLGFHRRGRRGACKSCGRGRAKE